MTQVQTGTYPIAEDVMNDARAMINDMLRSQSGQILKDTSPFSVPMLNRAIRRTQRRLANNGLMSNVIDNFILNAILPVANSDPGTQINISQNGYFNGSNVLSSPTLPLDLILPLSLAQRQTSSGAQFTPMVPAKGPLMSRIPGPYFGEWEWRGDALWMVGSSNTMDLRLRYEQAIARIAQTANLAQTTIQIRDGEDCLASGLVYVYAMARGAQLIAEAKAQWVEDCDDLITRYVRKDQRIAVRPKGYAAGGGTIDGALSGDYR